MQPLRSDKRIPELDGLRGIAIGLVLFVHYFIPLLHSSGRVANALALAWSGVDLFFVLSGFLLGGILLDNRDSKSYYKVFYVRRFFRIFPLYYAFIAFLFALSILLRFFITAPHLVQVVGYPRDFWPFPIYAQNLVIAFKNQLGASGLVITWSLAVEEQFYLFLPLLVRVVSRRRLPIVLCILIVSAPLLRTLLFYLYPIPAVGNVYAPNYVLMPCRADALFLGVLCAYAVRRADVLAALKNHQRLLYAAFVLLLAGVITLAFTYPERSGVVMNTGGYTLLALFYSCLLLVVVTGTRGPLVALTRFTPLRRLGILAYGVYLFHYFLLYFLGAIFLPNASMIYPGRASIFVLEVFALGSTLVLAHLSWEYFESGLVRKGHTFKYD